MKLDSLQINNDSRERYLEFYCGDTSGEEMTAAMTNILSEFRDNG